MAIARQIDFVNTSVHCDLLVAYNNHLVNQLWAQFSNILMHLKRYLPYKLRLIQPWMHKFEKQKKPIWWRAILNIWYDNEQHDSVNSMPLTFLHAGRARKLGFYDVSLEETSNHLFEYRWWLCACIIKIFLWTWKVN